MLHRNMEARMASLTLGTTGAALAHPLATLRRMAARIARWNQNRREAARVMQELVTADPRDLRDMGITAYDFHAIARGAFKRPN
jgi:uncharacterized protein YjiS (DUF1127 family)